MKTKPEHWRPCPSPPYPPQGLQYVAFQIMGLPHNLAGESLQITDPVDVAHAVSLILDILLATWRLSIAGAWVETVVA